MSGYFDKFMDDLEKREQAQAEKKQALQKAEDEWAARKLREKYQEKPENRITWSK